MAKAGARETQIIVTAGHYAAQTVGNLRLSIFGRHADLRETELREGLRDLPVELSVEGVVESAQVVREAFRLRRSTLRSRPHFFTSRQRDCGHRLWTSGYRLSGFRDGRTHYGCGRRPRLA